MRNTLLLIFITVFQAYADDTYSQNTKLTLNLNSVTVANVLEEIENKSEFYFLFNSKLVDVKREVSISMEDEKISDILLSLFSGTEVNYLVYDRQIILTPGDAALLPAIMLQQLRITGTVTDKNGSPVTGANVVVTGTTMGTITDVAGKYSIDVPKGSKSLSFSFIGMEPQEISIGTLTQIDVIMDESATSLEEVVVVGYGTQRKVNLTGSVSEVDSKVLESRPIVNIGQGLQGVVANLNISQANGSLGKEAVFNIRGNTSINGGSPLVLVNGVPMDINLINPNDVESVSVLKDAASAAIYGARGAYGVILITTKGGKKSEKMKISFSTNYSMNTPLVKFETMDVMEYMTYLNIASINLNGNPYFDQYYTAAITANYNDPSQPDVFIHPLKSPNLWAGCANTDWPNELLRDNYPMLQYSGSISGGSDKFDYYTSFSYFKEEGIPKNFDEKYNRYNFMTNLNYQVLKWATVGAKISTNYSKKVFSPNDNGDYFREDNIPLSTRNRPHYPVYFPDGNYGHTDGGVVNVVQLGAEGGYRTRDINDAWLTGLVKLEPVKNMTINIDYSFNLKGQKDNDYKRRIPLYDVTGQVYSYYTKTTSSSVTKSYSDRSYYALNAYMDYENTFNEKHYFKAMVGFNQENASSYWFQASRKDLIVETVPYMNLAYGDRYAYDSASEMAIRGVFSRLNYSFDDRYLFELNARYDGSSRFPEKDRFAFFPSLAIGWRIDNEAFFAGLKNSINMLKVRVSYGNLGNQNVSDYYPYIATYSSGEADYLINGIKPQTVYAPGLVSPSLTWETVAQQNLGVDFAVLDNKLSGSFDIYNRSTKNMLTKSQTLPAVLAENEPKSNAADMKTTGFDFTLNWKHSLHNVQYGITLLLSDYTSEITKYSNPQGLISDYYVGHKLGEIWGLETGGFFETDDAALALDQTQISGRTRRAGDIWFVDLDGDTKITRGTQTLEDHGDMKIIGNNTPRYSYGLKTYLSWKGFNLDLFLQGVAKRNLLLPRDYFLMQYTSEWPAFPKIGTDYWTPENRDAYFPTPVYTNDADVLATQSHFMQNAAYLRLKQLTIGYTIPMNLTQKIGVEKILVYFSGNNLWTKTKMLKVSDPDQSGTTAYPLYRSISLGANIDF